LTKVSKHKLKLGELTMRIISFSKKDLDEYMDTFSVDLNDRLDLQDTPLELTNSSKEAVSIPLDVESFTEV
jgi:hypothetical protein